MVASHPNYTVYARKLSRGWVFGRQVVSSRILTGPHGRCSFTMLCIWKPILSVMKGIFFHHRFAWLCGTALTACPRTIVTLNITLSEATFQSWLH